MAKFARFTQVEIEYALLLTKQGEILFLHTLECFCPAVSDPGSVLGRHGAEKHQGVLPAVEGDRLRVETGLTADQSHHLLLLSLSLCPPLPLSPPFPPILILCVSASPKANSELNQERSYKRRGIKCFTVALEKKRKASKIANLPLTFIPQPKE